MLPDGAGFRVLMAHTLVRDHRVNPGEEGRHWRIGDVVVDDDLEDRDRYPSPNESQPHMGRPNTWAWVWGGIVEPVGFPMYEVVAPIAGHGHNGANPNGRIRVGMQVCEAHFPDHVNVSALVDGGQLKPIPSDPE